MADIKRITNCLWFGSEAEDAAKFYTSIFKNSIIKQVTRFGKEGVEFHGQPEGTVMAIAFELDGQEFLGVNGNSQFKFNESTSFVINCETQQEIDFYWDKLIADGGEESYCGWLKDKYGVSWQVVPIILTEMLAHSDKEKVSRVNAALMQMKKLDMPQLQQAFDGK